MPTVQLEEIVRFFADDPNLVKRGEDAYHSNHVESFQHDKEMTFISGQVQASMKKKIYKVKVFFDGKGAITTTECECPRGKFKCHHAAALLSYGLRNISKTSTPCSWRKPKRQVDDPATNKAENLFPAPKKYRATKLPMRKEERRKIYQEVEKFTYNLGVTWLLSPEPEAETGSLVPSLENILFSEGFCNAGNKESFFLNKAFVPETEIARVASVTTGQSNNPLWYLAKKHRLTASNFGLILNACRCEKFPVSLFKTLKGVYKLDGIKSIQWGKEHEEDAIKAFENIPTSTPLTYL